MLRHTRASAVLALLCAVFLTAPPAWASYVVKDGNGVTQTMCSVTAAGVQTPCHAQPDSSATGTLNSATLNAAYTVTLGQGQGLVGFTVAGLTAAAATLTVEGSNDGGTTWSAVNKLDGATGILATTLTADGQFRVNAGGRSGLRLRVSTIGTGTISVASEASTATGEVALSAPLPPGANIIGQVTSLPPRAAVAETNVSMTGLWVKVWTAAAAKRVVIGLPSDSAASGDYSFNAALVGLSTSGGVPFAAGAGGSFDFAGGAVPNTDLYVKATNGSKVTVQVFN